MKKILLICIITSLPAIMQAQITEKNTTNIIKTLSSNDMRGRQAFSDEIWNAADFISDKFAEANLQPLKGEDNYLQKFTMYSTSLGKSSVQVGGKKISPENYFAMVNQSDVSWTASDDIFIIQIKKDDNLRAKLGAINKMEKNVIVFVDSSKSETFSRYRSYFSRATRSFKNNETKYNKLFILADKSDAFEIQLNKKVEKEQLANVAGKIEGKRSDGVVLFSGHYDHLGILKPAKGDSIANGANDDASGITAVIELAKHFSQSPKPERTIIFVAFTAEEVGGYGSQYFSRQLNPDNIVSMFNIEMIGKPGKYGPNSAWITGFNKSSFGKLLQRSAEGTNYTFYPDPYPNQHLFYRSDNATLARLGVPAHSISTTAIDVDPDYHQVTDEVSTLNLSHLTNTIQAISRAAQPIISGEATPTRVDAKSLNN